MKTLKYIFSAILILTLVWSCDEDNFGDTSFIDSITAPTNVSAAVSVTQDNTGLVTITPLGDGVASYTINFGDDSSEEGISPGDSLEHVYAEGTYEATITATSLNGLTTTVTQTIVVSFKSPENLMVTIENDVAVSKQVNLTATADYATSFEAYFGEPGKDDPIVFNIDEAISYQYADAGIYTIRVVAMSAAIETTEYSEEFEVTAILQPLVSAPTPPARGVADVISIYTSAYTNVPDTNYFPDWGQGSQGSGWGTFDLSGDEMLQYTNISYQGIALADGVTVDVSGMDYLHLDVWTADVVTDLETSLINNASGTVTEAPVVKSLTPNSWTSIEIPISDYTDQGLTVTEIFQMKFVGTPWAAGTVFIDNIYFYKESSDVLNSITPIDFEEEFSLSSFDGGDISVVANPDTTGNPSSTVAQMIKGSGQPWAGSKITIETPFDFSTNTVITAKVWSPRAGLNLLMKFEDAVPWPDVTGTADVIATTTVANQWETLTFDFTGIDMGIDWYNMVLIMDNGTAGDGSDNYTIYLDDISSNPMLDFEPDFSLSSFDGGDITIVANPDTAGNPSSMVAQMIKGSGQPWAGSKITFPTPFDFSTGTTITAKVWSPRAGLNLLLKFEDAVPWPDVTATAEITATTTIANGWETLTFDFSGVDMGIEWYNLVLIMDNGTQGDGSADYTIYVDDIDLN
ncbi:hypothetical protein [uncultured Algibacter sp.]|uniref:hypothetical protein n=1 Tax=uncultured Algibacter sp. TaxID=298659 RepID=UPI0026336214|nr:hypothetical protein [uncultured Algibacter sp.]